MTERIRAETDQTTGFIRVPYQEGIFLIDTEMNGNGPRILVDSTTLPVGSDTLQYIGHVFGLYQNALPSDATAFMLPTNNTFAENPQAVKDVLSHEKFSSVLIMGGEDPSPILTGICGLNGVKADAYGSYNPLRDAVNINLLNAAEEQRVFILGICRGLEIYATMHHARLIEADELHHPLFYAGESASEKLPIDHCVQKVEVPSVNLFSQLNIQIVNSHHHLALSLTDFTNSQLPELGWTPYYLSGKTGEETVEIAIRLDRKGCITGILTQGHPERQKGADGEMMRGWIKSQIIRNDKIKKM